MQRHAFNELKTLPSYRLAQIVTSTRSVPSFGNNFDAVGCEAPAALDEG